MVGNCDGHRPRAIYHAVCHDIDRCANGRRQVDAVMEVPTVSIDTRTVGGIHFVWRSGFVEGANEMKDALGLNKSFWARDLCFAAHRPFPFQERLGRRDLRHRSPRPDILEPAALYIQNPSSGNLLRWGRGNRGIRDHDDAFSSSKLFVVFGLREFERLPPPSGSS